MIALISSANSQSRGELFNSPLQQTLRQVDPYAQVNSPKAADNYRPSYQTQQQQQQRPQNYQTQSYNTQYNQQRFPIQNQQQYSNQPQSYQTQQQQLYRPVYDNVRPQQQQQQQQQFSNQPQLDQRFDGMLADDASASGGANNNDFVTRRPPLNQLVGQRVTKPPLLPPRFDDYNSRKLTWDEELSKNTELFALQLFAILTHYETENFMISPYSIHSLLVVLAEGAGGNTYNELNNALGLINKQRTRDFHQYTNLALK